MDTFKGVSFPLTAGKSPTSHPDALTGYEHCFILSFVQVVVLNIHFQNVFILNTLTIKISITEQVQDCLAVLSFQVCLLLLNRSCHTQFLSIALKVFTYMLISVMFCFCAVFFPSFICCHFQPLCVSYITNTSSIRFFPI